MVAVSLRRKIALLICPEISEEIEVREIVVARQAAAIAMKGFPLVNDLVEKLDPKRKEGRT
jgi:hypothetical protein